MFTKSKASTIFLDYESEVYKGDEKVNVILSPALYWVKKLSLPLKYTRDVKKLLPSIFEDILLDGNYSYDAYKEGEHFIAFAYDDKEILSLMEQKGLSASNIANIYFAQSEFGTIEGGLDFGTSKALVQKEGVLLLLEKSWLETTKPLDLSIIEHSKHTVNLSLFHHIVDKSVFYRLSGALLFFALLFVFEAFMVGGDAKEIAQKKSGLFEQYGLKPTMMQNSAMLKKYESIHQKQMALRSAMATLGTLKLKKGESLVRVEYKQEKLSVEFETQDVPLLEKQLKQSALNYTAKQAKERLFVEVNL